MVDTVRSSQILAVSVISEADSKKRKYLEKLLLHEDTRKLLPVNFFKQPDDTLQIG